jgi:CheY-like chemotaxis protein
MLGHELRNPLAPITTALYLLGMRSGETGARERAVIERHVRHLTRLVDDLLDVSRITRGKVELKRELVRIPEVIAKAIEMASPLLEQRAQHLELHIPSDGLWVEGDAVRLAQVFSNLLTNASKYNERGGRIGVSAQREENELVIRVRDTGIGIDPEMLPRVFDLFSQERQALDRSEGGLGLGLAIVRSLVNMHEGTVSAQSEGRGRGSEFVVRLPASEKSIDARAAEPGIALQSEPRKRGRVLVVDDNEDSTELLAEALLAFGYTARVAHDGPSALQVAAEFQPEIALLDIGLPVMDGYELASRLGSRDGKRIKLIALTGYGQLSDRERSKRAGFDEHLVKPVDIRKLRELIDGMLAGAN